MNLSTAAISVDRWQQWKLYIVTMKVQGLQKFSKVCQVRRANNLATFMC